MSNGFQFIDIILFAVIAAFLVLRLRGVLGRRDGHEQDPMQDRFESDLADPSSKDNDDNVIALPERGHDDGTGIDNDTVSDEPTDEEVAAMDHVTKGVYEIQRADGSFDPEEFLVGARVAFDMILAGYASGDRAQLKNLLSPDVFADFDSAITLRERNNQTVEDTLVGIMTSEIVEATFDGRSAFVTIKFVTEQVNATRDEDGTVVDGNPNAVITVTDFWTFSRDTRSRDPNWGLVATASSE